MISTKTFLAQELDKLNEKQLKQVADFIAFIKFRDRHINWQGAEAEMEKLYSEFAEEDQQFAEEELGEYAETLSKEDFQCQ